MAPLLKIIDAYQWRIQDFPIYTLDECVNLLFGKIFAENALK